MKNKRVVDVDPDGNCMFSALALQLKSADENPRSSMTSCRLQSIYDSMAEIVDIANLLLS